MIQPPSSAPGIEPKPPITAGREGLDPDESHPGLDERDGRQEDPGHRGDSGGDRPHQGEDPLDRDADVVGRELVLRRGLHADAEPRVAEEEEQHDAEDEGAQQDREVLVAHNDSADTQRLAGVRSGKAPRVIAPHQSRHGAEDEAQPDRQHHDGELRFAQNPAQHEGVEQIAEDRQRQDRQEQPQHPGHADVADQGHRHEGAQHHQIALGEVHHLGRLVDEDEAESDQAVDAADGQTIDENLQELTQSDSLPRNGDHTAALGLARQYLAALHQASQVIGEGVAPVKNATVVPR